jgi:hypothetical protein
VGVGGWGGGEVSRGVWGCGGEVWRAQGPCLAGGLRRALGRDSSSRVEKRGGAGGAHLHELPTALARALVRRLVQRVEEGGGRVVRYWLLRVRLHRKLVEHLQRLDEVELPGRIRGNTGAHALDPSLDHVRASAWLAPVGSKRRPSALASSLRSGALACALASRALARRRRGSAHGRRGGRGRLPRLRGVGAPRSRLRRRRPSGGRWRRRRRWCGCGCGCRGGDGLLLLRLAHVQVLDIVTAEDNVIKDVDGRGDGVVWLAVLCPVGAHVLERHRGVGGVDRVQRAFVADLGLRDEHDAGAQVRHGHRARR